jgi:hypothetical protein
MNKIFSIVGVLVVLSLLLSSISLSLPITPINATLKAVDASGSFTFDPSSTIAIVGVVENVKGSLSGSYFSYYVQDTGTGYGIDVYNASPGADYAAGDLMYAEGNITQFRGLIELVTTTNSKLGSGYVISPVVASSITVATTFDQTLSSGGEFYEGRVYKLNNVHYVSGTWGSNGNVIISDSSGGTIIMFLAAANQAYSRPQPTGDFSVTGIGTQYDSTSPYDASYEITPRVWSDIDDGTIVVPAPTISNSMYSPGIPTSTDSVLITATVTFDTAATPGTVQVITNTVGSATMYDDGAHGDGAAGDHVFGGYLPPGSDGANVGWYINATDNNYPSGMNDPGAAPGTVYYYPIRNNPTIEPIQTVRNAANATNHIIRGRVIAQPGNITSGTSMYIQDTTGGILVYSSKIRSVVEGDQVTVMGALATYFGEKEFSVTPTTVGNAINKDLVITVPAPVAKDITTATLNTDSTIQGTLVKFTNTGYASGWSWDSVVSSGQTKIDDGSGAAVMYIYGATGITDPGSSIFDVVGVAVQYNTTPELKPRHQSDFTAGVAVSPPNDMTLNPGDTVQFTASGGTGPYTWTCSNYAVGTVNSTGLFTAGPGLGTCHVTAHDSGALTGDSGTISVIATSAPIYIEPQSMIKVR